MMPLQVAPTLVEPVLLFVKTSFRCDQSTMKEQVRLSAVEIKGTW